MAEGEGIEPPLPFQVDFGFRNRCITTLPTFRILAALRGFEPRSSDSESDILPLDERAINLKFVRKKLSPAFGGAA